MGLKHINLQEAAVQSVSGLETERRGFEGKTQIKLLVEIRTVHYRHTQFSMVHNRQ
jgi:hypothetical protein